MLYRVNATIFADVVTKDSLIDVVQRNMSGVSTGKNWAWNHSNVKSAGKYSS